MLPYSYKGVTWEVTVGQFMKMLGGRFFCRIYQPLRNVFDIFDYCDLNSDEREITRNIDVFRANVKRLLAERRLEMAQPGFNPKDQYDFLTQLLGDDLFKGDEGLIINECMTFIGAATQTTTFLLTNIVYYLTKNPEIRDRALNEIRSKLLVKMPQGASLSDDEMWQEILLNGENLDNCPYLLQIILETLRIDSSSTISSAVSLTETT
jgi:cytochrome P450